MKTNSFQNHILTGLCLIALVAHGFAAQAGITAQIEPRSIGLGESAQLAITLKGSQAAEPNVPRVDGLDIVPIGQQSSMQIINGAVSGNFTYIYQVTANRTGSFNIPAVAAVGMGSTRPIAFRVDKGSGSQTQPAPSQNRSQPSAMGLSRDDDAVDTKGQSAFLRVVLPKQELTVGELVPVEIKAYFRAGVSASLNGLPMLSSDAFALDKLSDQPEQTRESINGVPYTVVTWTTALSAVKAGDYPLNLDLPVMVRVQEHARRGSGGRNLFKDFFGDDSPFDDSAFEGFFGQTTEKELTLHTEGDVMKIKALPAQGRPAGFFGAVGKFDVTSEATTTTGSTGDPLTFKITVTGRGNFDRVLTDGLPASAEWKSYKPSARFEAANRSSTTGTKTFEQSIVPLKAGVQVIPSLRFSYFDPDAQSYVTKTTAPIAIEIAQSAEPGPAAVQPAIAPFDKASKTSPDGLAADEVVPAHAGTSLRPLVLRPWFIAVNVLMLAALAIGAVMRGILERRARDPERLQREAAEKVVNESLATMDAALHAKDIPRFFDAARHALQERLAAKWHVPASSVTIPEIRTRLNGHGEEVRAVFQAADEISYSGKRFTTLDLQQWRDLVKSQLQQMARP
jgi:hypothetical protein